jgi:sugar transferase (PEP-CTERM/EpsH1 system associated)
LIVVLSRFPYPLEKGDKLRAYYQLLELSERFEVHLVCTTEQDVSAEDRAAISPYCAKMHVFKLQKISILWNLFLALFSKKPFQVAYFYQRPIHRAIRRIIHETQPAAIFCQLIRATEYVKHEHACPKTLDYMDAFSKGMERRIADGRGIAKWLFRTESKRLGQYERQVFDYFEHHTVISAQDRNYILHPSRQQIVLVPNGVDSRFFGQAGTNPQYDLLFTGNMSYAPNIAATQFIATELLPLLHQELPHLNCLISGATPHASLKNLGNSKLVIGGWIEDIRDSYSNARIFIAPMLIGAGLQNKLLEAMAMGLPCITTTLANNALLAKPETEILIADDAATCAIQVKRLLASPELYAQISAAGRRFVQDNYQWASANRTLIELLES